jgi:mono/diheme cytochrome c family protein
MLSKSLILGCVSGCALLAVCALADDKKTSYDTSKLPPASTKADVTYATDIQPIFEKSCYPCHGPKTPKPKGKLRVDTLEAVLKGGEDGAAVVPKDIANSPLLANVAHLGDADDFMPPPKNRAHLEPLTPEQVGLIRAWIEQGAK